LHLCKIPGDARFRLVLAEAEHANPEHQTTVGFASRIFGELDWAKDA